MTKPYTILVADYVPLENKGEEAIIRGIEDLLGDGRSTRMGVFGHVNQPTRHDSITVFPWNWIYRAQGNVALGGRKRLVHDIGMCIQMRLGFWGRVKNLTSGENRERQSLCEFFAQADCVLVGHDGVFCTESCAVIHWSKQQGKRVGILGASAVLPPKLKLTKSWLYRQALEDSDFCVFREHFAQKSLRAVARNPEKCLLAPDPAFAMKPAPASDAEQFLNSIASYTVARQGGRPVIAVTVVEKGRVYTQFRPDLEGTAKQQAHAQYIAEILQGLVRESGALLLFLPHAIEKDASDVDAAQCVVDAMQCPLSDAVVLDQDLDARMLKAIIAVCDFLVGERTHSLIGAVSVGTPFAGLTNTQDTRTHGIIGHMCDCEDQLINMDRLSADQAHKAAMEIWNHRQEMIRHLQQLAGDLNEQLQGIKSLVHGSGV